MTILIYHLDSIKGNPKMVEYGRFDNGQITGKIEATMTEEEVIDEFNRGYYRTSAV